MRSAWLRCIYHAFRGPHRLHPSVIDGLVTPMRFRLYQPRDRDQCMERYALNEPGRFPEEVINQYHDALTRQGSYILVLEKNDRIIASGGMCYAIRQNIGILSFGLVHPEHQGIGLGTALLL